MMSDDEVKLELLRLTNGDLERAQKLHGWVSPSIVPARPFNKDEIGESSFDHDPANCSICRNAQSPTPSPVEEGSKLSASSLSEEKAGRADGWAASPDYRMPPCTSWQYLDPQNPPPAVEGYEIDTDPAHFRYKRIAPEGMPEGFSVNDGFNQPAGNAMVICWMGGDDYMGPLRAGDVDWPIDHVDPVLAYRLARPDDPSPYDAPRSGPTPPDGSASPSTPEVESPHPLSSAPQGDEPPWNENTEGCPIPEPENGSVFEVQWSDGGTSKIVNPLNYDWRGDVLRWRRVPNIAGHDRSRSGPSEPGATNEPSLKDDFGDKTVGEMAEFAPDRIIDGEPPEVLHADIPPDAVRFTGADGKLYATFGGHTHAVVSAPSAEPGPAYSADHEAGEEAEAGQSFLERMTEKA